MLSIPWNKHSCMTGIIVAIYITSYRKLWQYLEFYYTNLVPAGFNLIACSFTYCKVRWTRAGNKASYLYSWNMFSYRPSGTNTYISF